MFNNYYKFIKINYNFIYIKCDSINTYFNTDEIDTFSHINS